MLKNPQLYESALKTLSTLAYSVFAAISEFKSFDIDLPKLLCFQLLYRFCTTNYFHQDLLGSLFVFMSPDERSQSYQIMLEHFDDNQTRFTCLASPDAPIDEHFFRSLVGRAQNASGLVRIQTVISATNALLNTSEITDSALELFSTIFAEYHEFLLKDCAFLQFLACYIWKKPNSPHFATIAAIIDPRNFVDSELPELKVAAGIYFTQVRKLTDHQTPINVQEITEQFVSLSESYRQVIEKILSTLKIAVEIINDPEPLVQQPLDDLIAMPDEAYQFQRICRKLDSKTFTETAICCKNFIATITQEDPEGSVETLTRLKQVAQKYVVTWNTAIQSAD